MAVSCCATCVERPALQLLGFGGVLAVNTLREGLQDDLSVGCKVQHHEYRIFVLSIQSWRQTNGE